MSARVTVVVVTYESADVIGDCLRSVAEHASGATVAVVDNASADGTRAEVERLAESLRGRADIRLLASEANEGFSRANNRALSAVGTEFALVLNPDARVAPGALDALVACADRRPDAAVIGPRTTNADGTPQVSFGSDLTLASERRQRALVSGVRARDPRALAEAERLASAERDVDWVSGSAMLLRVAAARPLGFFDERYFLYEEDADLCLRLRRAGHRVVFTPAARVVHVLGTSMAKASARARAEYDRSHLIYYDTHNGVAQRALLRLWMMARGRDIDSAR